MGSGLVCELDSGLELGFWCIVDRMWDVEVSGHGAVVAETA
jgi:hypothetical protein